MSKRKLFVPTLYPYVVEPDKTQPTTLQAGDIMEYNLKTSELIISRRCIPCDDRLRWNQHKNYIMRPQLVNESQFLCFAAILSATHGLDCLWDNNFTRYDWAVQFIKKEQR